MPDDERWFTGWASVEIVDSQGEKIAIDAFKKVMKDYMATGGPIIDTHSNKIVGNVVDYKFKKKNGNPGLWIKGLILDRYDTHDEVWKDLKDGVYTGLSMGGKNKAEEANIVCEGDTCFNHIKEIELFEISVVDKPANKESTIESVNQVAKQDKDVLFKSVCPEGKSAPCDTCKINKCDSNVSREGEESKSGGKCKMAEDEKTEVPDASLEEKTKTETEKQDDAPDAMEAIMERLDSMESRLTAVEEAKTAQDEEKPEEEDEEKADEDEEDDDKADDEEEDEEEKKFNERVDKAVEKKLEALKESTSEADTNRPKLEKTSPETEAEKKEELTPERLAKMDRKAILRKTGL